MQKKVLMLSAAVAVGALGVWGYQVYSDHYPSTEDAYVDANVVRVAPRVSGRIDSLAVHDQQQVKQGDLLFSIDPQPLRFALQQAQAQLELAKRQVSQAQATVTSAQAEVHNREVLLENARAKLKRAKRLARKDYVSAENVTDAEADFKSAEASLQVANAKLEEAQRQMGKPGADNDRILQAQAAVDQAQWDLNNARVSAACSGQIGELKLRPGNVVRADNDVFVLVCNAQYWIEANFKETQLHNIKSGQPVKIKIDMYPDHMFHGKVESVSAAAGSVFSLLPPQNANGNWVKVVQRIPVRISLTDLNASYPLRVGSSSVVTIDTTQTTEHTKHVATLDSRQ